MPSKFGLVAALNISHALAKKMPCLLEPDVQTSSLALDQQQHMGLALTMQATDICQTCHSCKVSNLDVVGLLHDRNVFTYHSLPKIK